MSRRSSAEALIAVILVFLHATEPLTAPVVAERAGISLPSVRRFIATLLEHGLVQPVERTSPKARGQHFAWSHP